MTKTRNTLDRAITASVAAMLAMALFTLSEQIAASQDLAAQHTAAHTLTRPMMA
jgi:hypothetical protein